MMQPPPRRLPHHGRCGFNIAELLFAITAVSALSVLAMTVVAMLMTAEQRSAEGLWVDATLANLAADLREDAHRATAFNVTPDADGRITQLTLVQPDEVHVIYRCTAAGVDRLTEVTGTRQAVETYRLAFGTSWFETHADEDVITWRHTRELPGIAGPEASAPSDAAPRRADAISAAIGLYSSRSQPEGT